MHYLLHIDTSADTGVLALSADGELITHEENTMSRNHAASINIMVGRLLETARITFGDLSGITVCAGPGSYTGLRIGLATAKGYCYALNKPLLMDNRLMLLARQAWERHGTAYDEYAVVLLARANEYFTAVYDNNFNCLFQPQHIVREQLESVLKKDTKSMVITDLPDDNNILNVESGIAVESDTKLDLKCWGKHAFDQIKCHNIEILSTAEPFYLKQVYTHK